MAKKYGLKQSNFPKNKQWQVDQDYIQTLSNTAKDWLNQFNSEYYGGGPKKGCPKALHNTDELRKDCYNRTNRANNDVYGIHSCSGKMWQDTVITEDGNSVSFLDTLCGSGLTEYGIIEVLDGGLNETI
jgi:hypothetical protein